MFSNVYNVFYHFSFKEGICNAEETMTFNGGASINNTQLARYLCQILQTSNAHHTTSPFLLCSFNLMLYTDSKIACYKLKTNIYVFVPEDNEESDIYEIEPKHI